MFFVLALIFSQNSLLGGPSGPPPSVIPLNNECEDAYDELRLEQTLFAARRESEMLFTNSSLAAESILSDISKSEALFQDCLINRDALEIANLNTAQSSAAQTTAFNTSLSALQSHASSLIPILKKAFAGLAHNEIDEQIRNPFLSAISRLKNDAPYLRSVIPARNAIIFFLNQVTLPSVSCRFYQLNNDPAKHGTCVESLSKTISDEGMKISSEISDAILAEDQNSLQMKKIATDSAKLIASNNSQDAMINYLTSLFPSYRKALQDNISAANYWLWASNYYHGWAAYYAYYGYWGWSKYYHSAGNNAYQTYYTYTYVYVPAYQQAINNFNTMIAASQKKIKENTDAYVVLQSDLLTVKRQLASGVLTMMDPISATTTCNELSCDNVTIQAKGLTSKLHAIVQISESNVLREVPISELSANLEFDKQSVVFRLSKAEAAILIKGKDFFLILENGIGGRATIRISKKA